MDVEKFFVYWSNLTLLLFLSFFTKTGYTAVAAPELRCVSVDSVGVVTISWIPPLDVNNEFVQYILYSSNTLSGPYNSTSINGYLTTTFVDAALASSAVRYYYLETVYNDGSGQQNSSPSDTASSMLPIVTAATDSTCAMVWNPVFSPDISSSLGIYTIYRRIGTSGPFSVIGNRSYGNETFNDTFKVCVDSIFYYIEIDDQSGCVSRSAYLKELFEDNTAPAPPIIDSITVNPVTNYVDMVWKPSSSPDTYGYLVYYFDQVTSSYLFQDTIWGRFSTSYTEMLATINPRISAQQFTVAAFDSCFNPNANTSAGAADHRTIHIKILPNNCENTVTIEWTKYINWSDLAGYEILVSVNNGPYQVVVTLTDTDTVYTHNKQNSLDLYCYKVRAFNMSRTHTSTSNSECALSSSLVTPKKQYFRQVTVERNKYIHILSLTDTTLPAVEYVLLRSLNPVNNFFEVARIGYEGDELIEIDDLEANVNQTSYYYRIGIVDTCGIIMYVSPSVNSIHLTGSLSEDDYLIYLHWNMYNGWDSVGSGVKEYHVYQLIDGQKELLTILDASTNSYESTIANSNRKGAKFCYEIEAVETTGNIYGYVDSVRSNRVCFTQNINMFVPNAFRPRGENPVFRPVVTFGELSSFKMTIYDRWGKTIYETNDIDKGWDGMLNGVLAKFDTYVYHIEIANFSGSIYRKTGTFILLR